MSTARTTLADELRSEPLRDLDIAIVGAGTAGLACAVALGRRGHRITVFERHFDHAAVGAGMTRSTRGTRRATDVVAASTPRRSDESAEKLELPASMAPLRRSELSAKAHYSVRPS